MIQEGLQSVPRKDRPQPEELEGYVQQTEGEPDYSPVRRELGFWLSDYRREEEEKRERQANGQELLPGHEVRSYLKHGARRGFSPEDFDLDKVVGIVKSTPRH